MVSELLISHAVICIAIVEQEETSEEEADRKTFYKVL